jgi:hypothetical protein
MRHCLQTLQHRELHWMPYLQLDLSTVRDYDENALGALFRDIADLRGARLTPEEVRSMYRDGIVVTLTGHGLGPAAELNYALYYRRISSSLPAVLTLVCHVGSGQSHDEILRQDRPERLIVAGTLNNGSFAGTSTTWTKQARPGSGKHALGVFMNGLLLAAYNIDGVPARTPESAWPGAAS